MPQGVDSPPIVVEDVGVSNQPEKYAGWPVMPDMSCDQTFCVGSGHENELPTSFQMYHSHSLFRWETLME